MELRFYNFVERKRQQMLPLGDYLFDANKYFTTKINIPMTFAVVVESKVIITPSVNSNLMHEAPLSSINKKTKNK